MPEPKDLIVRIPKLNVLQQAESVKVELKTDSQSELASAIAPTLQYIVEAAGIQLSPEQISEMQRAFLERGKITIEPGGEFMSNTLSVEATSLNWNSKVSPIEREALSKPLEGLEARRVIKE